MLYEQIKEDLIFAMKQPMKALVNIENDDRALRIGTLRMTKAAIDREAKDTGVEITDELVTKVLAREMKKRQESIEQYAKAGAVQLVAVETAEAAVLKPYLPQQMDKAKVEAMIDEVIKMHGKSIGPVMKEMKLRVGAAFPGKDLADLVKAKLQ
jgi:uncharacterized protein YqeY